ncbi:MAG: hypothetical protein ACTTHL_07675 [Oribacterium sp.]
MSGIHDLIHNKNDRNMLNAAPTYISEKGAQERLSPYLAEDLVKDEKSHKLLSRYRFHELGLYACPECDRRKRGN